MSKVRAGRSLFDALCDFATACGMPEGERARDAVDAVGEAVAPGVEDISKGDAVGGIAKIVVAHRKRVTARREPDHDDKPEKSKGPGVVKPF